MFCLLKQMPHSIKNLQELEEINLCENHLNEFPWELGFLPKLRELRITLDPPLEKFTEEINEKFSSIEKPEDLKAFLAELRRVYALKHQLNESS